MNKAFNIDSEAFKNFRADFNEILRDVLDTMRKRKSLDGEISIKAVVSLKPVVLPTGETIAAPSVTYAMTRAVTSKMRIEGALAPRAGLVENTEGSGYELQPLEADMFEDA